MRAFLGATILLLLCTPLAAQEVQITISVPSAALTPIQSLCTWYAQREQIRIASAASLPFNNQACVETLFKIGVRNAQGNKTRAESLATVEGDVSTALGAIETAWPWSGIYEKPFCGDGILDNATGEYDLGEQCDPPDGGVTCRADCTAIEP